MARSGTFAKKALVFTGIFIGALLGIFSFAAYKKRRQEERKAMEEFLRPKLDELEKFMENSQDLRKMKGFQYLKEAKARKNQEKKTSVTGKNQEKVCNAEFREITNINQEEGFGKIKEYLRDLRVGSAARKKAICNLAILLLLVQRKSISSSVLQLISLNQTDPELKAGSEKEGIDLSFGPFSQEKLEGEPPEVLTSLLKGQQEKLRKENLPLPKVGAANTSEEILEILEYAETKSEVKSVLIIRKADLLSQGGRKGSDLPNLLEAHGFILDTLIKCSLLITSHLSSHGCGYAVSILYPPVKSKRWWEELVWAAPAERPYSFVEGSPADWQVIIYERRMSQ